MYVYVCRYINELLSGAVESPSWARPACKHLDTLEL
jgi:hypothetical protein